MHELGVVKAIREIALDHARLAGASRVLSVRVAIAESSRYVEDALAMFWGEVCGTSEVSGARIEFVRIPGEWVCLACAKSFSGGRENCRCPACESEWVKPVDAMECYVESIEVETSGG